MMTQPPQATTEVYQFVFCEIQILGVVCFLTIFDKRSTSWGGALYPASTATSFRLLP